MFLSKNYSVSRSFEVVPPPLGFLDRVADKTIVNWSKLHDHIPSVKNTSKASLAIVLSLYESKNSIISAAVPRNKQNCKNQKFPKSTLRTNIN